jgi:hypothetical protein
MKPYEDYTVKFNDAFADLLAITPRRNKCGVYHSTLNQTQRRKDALPYVSTSQTRNIQFVKHRNDFAKQKRTD